MKEGNSLLILYSFSKVFRKGFLLQFCLEKIVLFDLKFAKMYVIVK